MAPLLGEHRRREVAREDHRRAQVDLKRAVDLLVAVVQERAGGRHGCVGDQQVDVSDLPEQAIDLGGLLEIHGERAGAELLREWFEHVGATAREDQLGATPMQRACDRVPDASRRPCQQCGSSGQMLGHGPNTASVAVKPCRWALPPTGPISPAAKNPATGAPASAASAVSAS
jgi:hypothetical protein